MRPSFPDDLEQTHQSLVMPRLEDIRNHGKEIHKALKDSADNIKPDKRGENWLAYVDYVNSLVIEGITTGIIKSMSFMADQINIPYNKHHGYPPIFDIRVDLRDRDVIFDPSIQGNVRGNGIRNILDTIIEDFISISKFNQIVYELIKKDSFGIFNISLGKKIYINQLIAWLNFYNTKKIKVINPKNSFNNDSFTLNNNKLMKKIKIKNNVLELKNECLRISKIFFK